MNTRILIIVFLFTTSYSFCQQKHDLAGKWQCCDSLVSAGYHSLIIFNMDSTFEYRVSEYASDNPLESIVGSYRTIMDTLFFDVQYFQYKGQEFRLGTLLDEDDNLFYFENNNPYKIKCKGNCKLKAIIEKNDSASAISILINGFDFYKVE